MEVSFDGDIVAWDDVLLLVAATLRNGLYVEVVVGILKLNPCLFSMIY